MWSWTSRAERWLPSDPTRSSSGWSRISTSLVIRKDIDVAKPSKRSHLEQQRHNRWALLQWSLLAIIVVLGTISLFVFFDGGSILNQR